MDGYSGKRGNKGQPDSKKGGGIVLRDRYNTSSYGNAPICSRVGLSAGKSPVKGTWIGSSDRKDKSVLSSFRSSSNGKEIIGASSKPRGSLSSSAKSEKKLLMSQIAVDSSDSSSSSEEEAEAQTLDASFGKGKKRVHHRLGFGDTIHEKFKTCEGECSNMTSSSRMKRGFRQSSHGFRAGPSSQAASANTISRLGLRNRSCRAMLSGMIPSGFGSEKRPSQKTDNTRKSFGESSTSSFTGGKNRTEPQAEERCNDADQRVSVSDNRRGRNFFLNSNNDVASVGARRSVRDADALARFSTRGIGRNGLSSITIPEMSQTETSTHLDSPVSLELFRGFPEVGLPGSVMSQDTFHGYNLDEISEMLPELDRIERDIELNYEELLVMETGLLLGGLSFYDRHRDMRLDIDNMSYEELLALEERIGSVSTALSEETISKCMKTTFFQISSSDDETMISPCGDKHEVKCSICQEEYTVGDEVGRLHCEHMYHVGCLQEWLRLKNWCPICRASAEPSSQSSSSQFGSR